jgi:ubiquinone/menaquinone biosynthesis C-methylase UbiE
MFELTMNMLTGLPKNGETDPIEYYRKPLVGNLYMARINLGLSMLPARRFKRAVEVGYGAGAVQLALAPGVEELHGIDLDADPTLLREFFEQRRVNAALRQGSVYEMPYDSGSFDLVVSFSVFEHLKEYRQALSEVHRVLNKGGLFLLGMPSVNRLMEFGFQAIGFRGIEDIHITTPAQVAACFEATGFRCLQRKPLDFPLPQPLGLRLYHNWLLEKI